MLVSETKDGDRVTLDTPLSVSIRIYKERNPAIAAALQRMRDQSMKPDGLIEAVLVDISAKFYAEARLMGHTHQQIMSDPLLVDPVYSSFRVNQGLTEEQAREVCDITRSDRYWHHSKEMRAIYRVVHKSGLPHGDCLWAMEMVPQSFRRVEGRVLRMKPVGLPYRKFESFVRIALYKLHDEGEEPDVNEVWRAWLTACGQEVFDLPRPEQKSAA